MGINIGAFIAPIVMEIVKSYFGFHAAFAVAAFGMVISVAILWYFKNLVEDPNKRLVIGDNVIEDIGSRGTTDPTQAADTAATAVDAPPHGVSDQDEGGHRAANAARQDRMNAVPDWKRILALCVIFAIVIVFWMVFHQNGSTLTYWADDNTDWNVSGTISNSINAFWVVTLTFPLIWFWGFLDKRGKEPSTPTKMAIGMTLTGLSFLVLWYGATVGESKVPMAQELASGAFRVNERVITNLGANGVPKDVLDKIVAAKDADGKNLIYGVKFAPKEDEKTKQTVSGEQQLINSINAVAPGQGDAHRAAILQNSFLFRVSAFWLILAYAIVTLGELMLSPMGLSLVSKVAPVSKRGLLMGGWFVATAIGNKLTQIGIFWDIWLQSTFFLVLAGMALFMAVVLFFLLKPLKKAMPGV
jgi:POT family proton-dependent oligopeptide transporter